MWEFYIKRFCVKVMCWFIPTKKARVALRSKMRFGKEIVPLGRVDYPVPKDVLLYIQSHSPIDFLSHYKTMLNPTPLQEILESRTSQDALKSTFMPPPH